MCGRIVCLYILRYIYAGCKPTNVNCSFRFSSGFFLFFFLISCFLAPRGSSARGRCGHLSVSKGIFSGISH